MLGFAGRISALDRMDLHDPGIILHPRQLLLLPQHLQNLGDEVTSAARQRAGALSQGGSRHRRPLALIRASLAADVVQARAGGDALRLGNGVQVPQRDSRRPSRPHGGHRILLQKRRGKQQTNS